jgi:hypothetical protein
MQKHWYRMVNCNGDCMNIIFIDGRKFHTTKIVSVHKLKSEDPIVCPICNSSNISCIDNWDEKTFDEVIKEFKMTEINTVYNTREN